MKKCSPFQDASNEVRSARVARAVLELRAFKVGSTFENIFKSEV